MKWTDDTAAIVSAHCKDFNVSNYSQKVPSFPDYVKSLGGIFTEMYGYHEVPKTVQDFRRQVEYIAALMAIWGIDYSNGNSSTSHYYRWGKGSSDAFRSSGKGKCKGGTISAILNDPTIVTTNCNYGINTLLRHMGCYKAPSESFKTWASYGKVVTQKKDLRVGDFVHFFSQKVNRAKPTTWKGWVHIAIVVGIEGSKIWLADFGSRFIQSKTPYHYMILNTSDFGGGEYQTRYWTAIHWIDLKEETVKTDADYAVELKRNIDAYLEAKQKEYGDSVFQAAKVFADVRPIYLRAAADYVLNGYAGSGEARKVFFGSDYDDVQQKVNWIIQTAQEVIDGKYGTGDARKEALGPDYQVVQNQVNRMLT